MRVRALPRRRVRTAAAAARRDEPAISHRPRRRRRRRRRRHPARPVVVVVRRGRGAEAGGGGAGGAAQAQRPGEQPACSARDGSAGAARRRGRPPAASAPPAAPSPPAARAPRAARALAPLARRTAGGCGARAPGVRRPSLRRAHRHAGTGAGAGRRDEGAARYVTTRPARAARAGTSSRGLTREHGHRRDAVMRSHESALIFPARARRADEGDLTHPLTSAHGGGTLWSSHPPPPHSQEGP
jgi:hypothetical protein